MDEINSTQYLILEQLKKHPMTRSMLARKTGIPRSTLFDILTKWADLGYLTYESRQHSRTGRPNTIWKLEGG